jgi:hypothetical protein
MTSNRGRLRRFRRFATRWKFPGVYICTGFIFTKKTTSHARRAAKQTVETVETVQSTNAKEGFVQMRHDLMYIERATPAAISRYWLQWAMRSTKLVGSRRAHDYRERRPCLRLHGTPSMPNALGRLIARSEGGQFFVR